MQQQEQPLALAAEQQNPTLAKQQQQQPSTLAAVQQECIFPMQHQQQQLFTLTTQQQRPPLVLAEEQHDSTTQQQEQLLELAAQQQSITLATQRQEQPFASAASPRNFLLATQQLEKLPALPAHQQVTTATTTTTTSTTHQGPQLVAALRNIRHTIQHSQQSTSGQQQQPAQQQKVPPVEHQASQGDFIQQLEEAAPRTAFSCEQNNLMTAIMNQQQQQQQQLTALQQILATLTSQISAANSTRIPSASDSPRPYPGSTHSSTDNHSHAPSQSPTITASADDWRNLFKSLAGTSAPLPDFSGLDYEDPEVFLRECQYAFEKNGTEMHTRTRMATCALKGDAAKWWQPYSSINTSWQKFEELL